MLHQSGIWYLVVLRHPAKMQTHNCGILNYSSHIAMVVTIIYNLSLIFNSFNRCTIIQ